MWLFLLYSHILTRPRYQITPEIDKHPLYAHYSKAQRDSIDKHPGTTFYMSILHDDYVSCHSMRRRTRYLQTKSGKSFFPTGLAAPTTDWACDQRLVSKCDYVSIKTLSCLILTEAKNIGVLIFHAKTLKENL